MITQNQLKKIDSKSMFKIYDDWPKISKESYNFQENFDLKNITHIVLSGMGGSGALGDMFQSILSKTNMHVTIVKGYHLPKTVNENTLVITTSISGNTIETLNVLDSAVKNENKVIAVSSGGKMKEYCKKHKVDYVCIPQYHSPRASFPAYLFGMLSMLKPILPIKDSDVLESIEELKKLSNLISTSNLSDNNPSLKLASWISGIPMIYYPWGLNAAAIRFKNSLQENAKIHAMIEDILEASHNGIISWEKSSNVHPILIQGKDDFFKTKERWKIIKEYFNKNQIDYKEIFSVKGNIISKIICLIYQLDYASIYHAILSNTDPSPINSINFIKDRIS